MHIKCKTKHKAPQKIMKKNIFTILGQEKISKQGAKTTQVKRKIDEFGFIKLRTAVLNTTTNEKARHRLEELTCNSYL